MHINMKKQLFILYAVSFLIVGIVLAVGFTVLAGPLSSQKKSVRVQPGSATNTAEVLIPSYRIHTFDALEDGQGVCLKIKNGDGNGFTYVTAQNGSLNASTLSCE